GRGIPVGMHEKAGRPAVEVIMTVLHAGGKCGGGGYQVSGGLHGVGAAVVNALSSRLDVDVHLDGKIHHIAFEKGIPVSDLEIVGDTDKTGTETSFAPDPSIFNEGIDFDAEVLSQRLRELAFLNKGLSMCLEDKRTDDEIVTY